MLSILHIVPYAPNAWAYGGIPRVAAALTRAQARAGHRVTLCATDVCDRTRRLGSGSRFVADGVEHRIFPNISNRLAYDRQLFTPIGLSGYLRNHVHTFDVAHLHACRNLPGAIGAWHLHRAGVPYVVAPNGTAPRLERYSTPKRLYDVLFGRRMLRRAACVQAVSAAEAAQLRQLGLPASVIRVVPNPVDVEELGARAVPGRFRARFALGTAPIVLFLGKMTARKNVDVVVRAFARLPGDVRLVLAGNDMGSGTEARVLVRSLGISNRTVFTGLLAGRARAEALTDATVVAYPSAHEIFGLVPLEGLHCGTPVVVADDSGCGEVIRQTGGGQLVQPGSVDALTVALSTVLGTQDEWRARARTAGSRVRAAYNPDAVASALLSIYGELARRSTVRRTVPLAPCAHS